MVLSFTDHPFDVLMKTQQNTWDSVECKNVDTVYYYGGGKGWNGKEFSANTNDLYYFMSAKFALALKEIALDTYDYIFRTNSSSYVNKKELVEFAKTLPTEKLYAGWTFVDSEDHGGLCVSGAGIFLSPDTAKILLDNIDPNFEQEEDVYAGRILRKHGITAIDDKSRYDVESFHPYIPTNLYHYRCKTGNRLIDAHNMVMLHKKIVNNG